MYLLCVFSGRHVWFAPFLDAAERSSHRPVSGHQPPLWPKLRNILDGHPPVLAHLPGPLCQPFCAEGTQADGGASLSPASRCPVLGASVPHALDQGSAAETAAGVGGRTEGPGRCSATQPGPSAFPALEASASSCSSAPGRLTSFVTHVTHTLR